MTRNQERLLDFAVVLVAVCVVTAIMWLGLFKGRTP